jgi:hypothetical protein
MAETLLAFLVSAFCCWQGQETRHMPHFTVPSSMGFVLPSRPETFGPLRHSICDIQDKKRGKEIVFDLCIMILRIFMLSPYPRVQSRLPEAELLP